MPPEPQPRQPDRLLVVVAAPREAEAVLDACGLDAAPLPRRWVATPLSASADLVLTGVGKANASGAVGRCAAPHHGRLMSLGLAGSLPGSGLDVGDVIACEWCTLADEGRGTPAGFRSLSAMGFPAVEGRGERFETDPAWRAALRWPGAAGGGCATVSTCSATDDLAAEIARRTGAACEDMESAAVGLAAARLGRSFACVRVVSNRTGADQGWDLELALSVLRSVAAEACAI